MHESNLPGGREFFSRFSVTFGLAGIGAAVVVLLYLAALLQLPPDQARGLWWMVAAVAVGITPVCLVVQNRMMRKLVACLDALHAKRATPDQMRDGFATAIDLPRRCALFGATNFAAGSSILVVAMFLVFEDFRLHSGILILAAASTGGVLAGLIQFFVTKQHLDPVRRALAEGVSDVDDRNALVHRVPLVRKISVVLVTVALVPVIFSVFLAYSRASSSAVSLVQQLHTALLERAVDRMAADGEPDVATLVLELQEDADHWGVPSRLVDLGDADVAEALLSPEELRWIDEQPGERARGDTEVLHGPNVVTWVREPQGDETLELAVITPRDRLWSGDGLAFLFAVVVGIASLVALVVAWLLARDVGRTAFALEDQVAQVAAGDLTARQVIESEDELGQLGRSFFAMSTALRSTVGRVVETSNRVEETGAHICENAERVMESSRARAESTAGCVRAVTAVNGQAKEIRDATSALNLLAEESSSSVLEMGASGDELRENAAGLSDRVEEVSAAIEQSLRAIGSVRDNTADLASASEQTSTSMEEMAAAMRQVDATAEETASLAAEVIAAAQTGQRKVLETVEGMQSIQHATSAAERVMTSLGGRIQEIGAVLEVIHDIANRTNLLALNASIIAAQAGEHGRPFAVVAGEISDLAVRVRSSSEEIGEVIRAVQEESGNAAAAIETGSQSVDHGVVLANEAGESLDAITASATKSSERSREIVQAVREQSKAAAHVAAMMDTVNEGLGAIRRATEEQTRGHETVADGTRRMSEVSRQLATTTEEQARGVKRIGESAEGVREASEAIHALVESQTAACATSAELLQQLAGQTAISEEGVSQMEEAIRELVRDSQTLRTDVARFRL